MIIANNDLRLAAAGAGVRLWQVADALGLCDSNLSRRLRHELPDNEKAEIMQIIKRLAATNQAGENNAAP